MAKFSNLLTVRAEGADAPPFKVSLTVKIPFFTTSHSIPLKRQGSGPKISPKLKILSF